MEFLTLKRLEWFALKSVLVFNAENALEFNESVKKFNSILNDPRDFSHNVNRNANRFCCRFSTKYTVTMSFFCSHWLTHTHASRQRERERKMAWIEYFVLLLGLHCKVFCFFFAQQYFSFVSAIERWVCC